MNKRIAWLSSLLLVCSIGVAAQESPRMFVVYEEMVLAAHLDAYVESSKEFGRMLIEADPDAEWQSVMLEDFHFYWVIPISSFGEIDGMQQMMMTMFEKAGPEKTMKMMDTAGRTTHHMDAFVVVERPDLSYHPKTMVPQSETMVLEYSYYYLTPGKEFAAEALAKEYAAKMKEKGVESGYTVYQLAFGADMPALAVVVPARSLEELQTQTTAFMKKMGADGEALQKKANAITRRFDRRIGYPRPDLSSIAFKKPAEK